MRLWSIAGLWCFICDGWGGGSAYCAGKTQKRSSTFYTDDNTNGSPGNTVNTRKRERDEEGREELLYFSVFPVRRARVEREVTAAHSKTRQTMFMSMLMCVCTSKATYIPSESFVDVGSLQEALLRFSGTWSERPKRKKYNRDVWTKIKLNGSQRSCGAFIFVGWSVSNGVQSILLKNVSQISCHEYARFIV